MKANPNRANEMFLLLRFRNGNGVPKSSQNWSLKCRLENDCAAIRPRLGVGSQEKNLAAFPTAICG